ncbi:MAG: septum formation initiator family protein [Oscillospiraceae bacterium]|nr:septum formation initiator family protein [Oscillospiraceae bacterium]
MNELKETALDFISRHRRAIKIWIFVLVVGGMLFKGIMQQPQINDNRAQIAHLEEQIEYEQTRQAEIEDLKDKVNSDEYIEKMASEKLGLVKSTAKIFIDVSQEQ